MISISYNGIFMKVVRTNYVGRDIIMSQDGTTYLWTKWTFDCDCVYNPAATAWKTSKQVGQGDLSPIEALPDAGVLPAHTDAAIRHRLKQPQKQLFVNMIGRPEDKSQNAGNDSWIISPLPVISGGDNTGQFYTCDTAGTGPIPEKWDVIANHGDHTFLVRFRITTCINENPNRTETSLTPLLSHRWTRYVDVDEDHFAVVITEGEAIFRVDELVRLGRWPDEHRLDLFHPVPKNCKRDSVNVVAIPDQTGVRYRIVDSERAFNFANQEKHGTRIEIIETNSYSRGSSALGYARNLVSGNAGLARNAAAQSVGVAAVTSAIPVGIVGGPMAIATAMIAPREAQIINQALPLARTFQDLMYGSLPRFGMHITVKVWGNRRSNRKDLKDLAFAVSRERLRWNNGIQAQDRPSTMSTEIVITQDVTGKYVEIQTTLSWGMENDLNKFPKSQDGPDNLLNWNAAIDRAFVSEDTSPWLVSTDTQPNPPLPFSNNTRGTLLERIIAQVLTGEDALPAKPPSPGETPDFGIVGRPDSPYG